MTRKGMPASEGLSKHATRLSFAFSVATADFRQRLELLGGKIAKLSRSASVAGVTSVTAPPLGVRTQVADGQLSCLGLSTPADSNGGSTTATPAVPTMSETDSVSELASSESLQKLDQRHEDLLVKLDALYRELETALANLLPKQKEAA